MYHVGNSQFQKVANAALVIDYLRRHRKVSRQDIAKAVGLRPSSVTYIINRLMQQGIVQEVSGLANSTAGSSTGSGRPPVLLELSSDAGMVIGLDLQADYYCVVMTDIRGDELLSYRNSYDSGITNFEHKFHSTIQEILPRTTAPILGLGLSIPGTVDSSKNMVKSAWTHELYNEDLSDLFQEYSFPITLQNDADCCAQQILWRDNNRDSITVDDSFIYLLTRFHNPELLSPGRPSVGVGLGLVFDGSLYRGYRSEAGEYQSILFAEDNPPTWQVALTADEMDRAALDIKIQQRIIRELLGNFMLLFHVLNPRALYIGGDLAIHRDLIFKELETTYKRQWEYLQKAEFSVVVVENGQFDPAWGAASVMLEDLYSIPQVGHRHRQITPIALSSL